MKKIITNFKQVPKFLQWIILISLILFIVSLTQPAFFIDQKDDPNAYSNSLLLFLTGWMSFLGGAFIPFVIWLANPLYFTSIYLTTKNKSGGLYLSCSATFLAIIFSQLNVIMTSESGSTSEITSKGLGFKLWLTSFVFLALGTFINHILTKRKDKVKT